VKLIDSRQPRLGQAITGVVVLVGFVAKWPQVLPVIAVVLALASIVGSRANLYVYLFGVAKRTIGFGSPKVLEESWPPRFANLLGFIFLGAASVALYGFGSEIVAWSLGLLVSALALLAATTGLCVGCELYAIGRRILTHGQVKGIVRMPPERARSGA